jgi:hypothetical protein
LDGKTFAELDGLYLRYPAGKEPFKRLLSFHAKCSFTHALRSTWITQETFDQFETFHSLSVGGRDPSNFFHN